MNPQYHYEKAYLSIKSLPCEWELHLKPKPYSLSRTPGKSWRTDNPDFRILPASTDKPDLSMTLFMSDISENYIKIMEPFPSHQWMMLRLLYEGAVCLELALSNPVLFYCIANNAEFLAKPEDRITVLGKLCRKKQKELLDWLGFAGNPSTVRMFQKILPEAVNPSIMRMFRSALKITDGSKALGHLKHINAGVMAIVTNKNIAGFITPRLLLEVSETPEEQTASPLSDLLFETCSMYEAIRERYRIRRPVFESIAGIQRIHNTLIPQYNQAITTPPVVRRIRPPRQQQVPRRKSEPACQFGIPPVPGTEDIIPITFSVDLADEGIEMHNCVSTYRYLIQQGKTYIYRVEKPERATLAIIQDLYGTWRISQLKGRRNRKVSPATFQAVNRWLDKAKTETWKLMRAEGQ